MYVRYNQYESTTQKFVLQHYIVLHLVKCMHLLGALLQFYIRIYIYVKE